MTGDGTARARGRGAADRERELEDQVFRLRIQKSMGQLEAPRKYVTPGRTWRA